MYSGQTTDASSRNAPLKLLPGTRMSRQKTSTDSTTVLDQRRMSAAPFQPATRCAAVSSPLQACDWRVSWIQTGHRSMETAFGYVQHELIESDPLLSI